MLDLAPRFDIFAENFKSGAMDRMGLGYSDIVAVHPRCMYASVSGFGNSSPSPYRDWPAFAPIVEAMSGVYEMKRIGRPSARRVARWVRSATSGRPSTPQLASWPLFETATRRDGRVCRCRDARLRYRDDGHCDQLLVDGRRQR